MPRFDNLRLFGEGSVPSNLDYSTIGNYGFGGLDNTAGNIVGPTGIPQTNIGDFSSLQNFGGAQGAIPGALSKGPSGYSGIIDSLNAASNLSNAYLGYKNYELGRDQFGLAKDSFNKNLANQVQSYNTQLTDQQRSRLQNTGNFDRPGGAANLEADLASYVARNKLSGAPV